MSFMSREVEDKKMTRKYYENNSLIIIFHNF